MKIGIISDTHDNVPAVERAVEYFNNERVSAVLHCGDFVAPFSLLPFRELACGKLIAVYGNNDGETKGLKQVFDDNGWRLENGPLELELHQKKIVMMHEPDHENYYADNGNVDLIASGHMHKVRMEDRNGSFILNPGEAGGWVTGKSSIAIVDLETMEATIHYI